MKKKTILIFGGGVNQLTLIKAAKKLGLNTIVIDPNDNAPGKEIADIFYCVGGSDFETTKKIAIENSVDGIVTSQMQNPLRVMAKLANELGLLFCAPEIIEISVNKYLMKEVFQKNDVPCAKGKLFEPDEKINKDSLIGFNFPLIIKPVDSHSSRGVYKINSFKDIDLYRNETIAFSTTGAFLIEEFIEGKEYSIETITYAGETTIIQYTEKIITEYPYTVEMGHIQPAELSYVEKRKIDNIVIKAIKSLKLDCCAAHTELKLTKEGPKIIEIGARSGGDYISSFLTLHSTGIDMDTAIINVALGNKPELQKKFNKYSGIFYFHLGEGKKILIIEDWKEVLKFKNVIYADISCEQGSIIPALTDSSKRSGFVILESNSRDSLLDNSIRAIKFILSKIILQ